MIKFVEDVIEFFNKNLNYRLKRADENENYQDLQEESTPLEVLESLNEEKEESTTEKEKDVVETDVNNTPTTQEEYISKFTDSTRIKGCSDLTGSQIDELLESRALQGIGDVVQRTEQVYGIISYFILAVAAEESGWGTSNLAKNKNNLFGFYNKSFENREDSVKYFGSLMMRYQKEGIEMTPAGINKKYAESTSWSNNIVTIMNQLLKKAQSKYNVRTRIYN